MHFPGTVRGVSKSRSPPTSPLVLAVGSFTPQAGVKDIVHHQIQEPRATGNVLAQLLSEEAPGARPPLCPHLAGVLSARDSGVLQGRLPATTGPLALSRV